MSKIAILCAGGTIAMVPSENGLIPNPDFPNYLSAFLREKGVNDCTVLAHLPAIDSSSATPADWLGLATHIRKIKDEFSGFVILHGTDTLAYTASALSILLAGLNKPLAITGSQIPLIREDTDAVANIFGAIEHAKSDYHSPAVYFGGQLMDARWVRKFNAQDFRAFEQKNAVYPEPSEKSAFLNGQDAVFDPNAVAMIYLYPGMPKSAFLPVLADENIRAVVLQTYGVGNLPDRSDLHEALIQALQRGVKMVNVTQCFHGEVEQDTYAVGAEKLGILSGGMKTPEYAYAELHCEIAFKNGRK